MRTAIEREQRGTGNRSLGRFGIDCALILGAQIGRGMQENRNQLLDVKLLVDKIAAGDFEEGKGLDEDSLKLIEDFLAAYDGYTPKVKKADLTNFGASLESLRDAAWIDNFQCECCYG